MTAGPTPLMRRLRRCRSGASALRQGDEEQEQRGDGAEDHDQDERGVPAEGLPVAYGDERRHGEGDEEGERAPVERRHPGGAAVRQQEEEDHKARQRHHGREQEQGVPRQELHEEPAEQRAQVGPEPDEEAPDRHHEPARFRGHGHKQDARGKAQEQPSPEPRQRVPQGHLREGAGGGRPHPGHGHHAQREEERPAQAEPGMDVVHQRLDQPHDQEVAERQPPEVDEIRVEVAGKRQIGRAERRLTLEIRQHPADEGH